MNGRDKRIKRAERARNQAPLQRMKSPWGGKCPNGCGEPGPHFVPPSFGWPGFFICTPPEEAMPDHNAILALEEDAYDLALQLQGEGPDEFPFGYYLHLARVRLGLTDSDETGTLDS